METKIEEIKKERDLIERKIDSLLATFAEKHNSIEMSVSIETYECRDVTAKIIATCFKTKIKLLL